MPVIATDLDRRAATLTAHVQLHTYLDRAWELWADPRLLERWWGPAGPSTVLEHDLVPGGRVTYVRRDPDAEPRHGSWDVVAVEPPRRLEVQDRVTDSEGVPDGSSAGRHVLVRLEPVQDGVAMSLTVTYPDVDRLDEQLALGLESGVRRSLAQLDALL